MDPQSKSPHLDFQEHTSQMCAPTLRGLLARHVDTLVSLDAHLHEGPQHTTGQATQARVSLGQEVRSAPCQGDKHVHTDCPARMNRYNPNPQRPTLTHKWTHSTDTHPPGGHTRTQARMYSTDFPLHIHTYPQTHTAEKPVCPLADNQIHASITDTHVHICQHTGAHTYNIYSLAHTGDTQVQALKCPDTLLNTNTTSHIPKVHGHKTAPSPHRQMHKCTHQQIHTSHIHRTTSTHRQHKN